MPRCERCGKLLTAKTKLIRVEALIAEEGSELAHQIELGVLMDYDGRTLTLFFDSACWQEIREFIPKDQAIAK